MINTYRKPNAAQIEQVEFLRRWARNGAVHADGYTDQMEEKNLIRVYTLKGKPVLTLKVGPRGKVFQQEFHD